MKNILVILVLALLLPFMNKGCATQNKEKDLPNIIFILADDLGAGDLHCTGHPYAKTPNIDKLADKGILFEHAYMAAAWCAPSRYALMTGKFPAREFDRTRNLQPGETNIMHLMQNAGYSTAHFGKWHLSYGEGFNNPPGAFGIDEYFLTSHSGTDKTWTKEERNKEYWRANLSDAYVDMTIDYIKRTKAGETPKPFYVNLWLYATHSYIHPTPEQIKVYDSLKVNFDDFSPYQQEFLKFVAQHGDINKSMQAYCADITAMDNALGRLFDFLSSEGLDKNTLIIFSSDNGPGPLTPQVISGSVVKRYEEKPDLLNSVGSAKIYKERKISLHEGGIRVPFIVSWPGNTPEGKIDKSSVIHGTDLLPTLASICNIDLPEGMYDGTDAKQAFLGKAFDRNKKIYWTQAGNVAVLDQNWKGMLTKSGEFKLYDIVKDPEELNEVHTDFIEQAIRLESTIKNWKKEMNQLNAN